MTGPGAARRLLVATHNAGKLEEFAAILAPRGISVSGAAEMGLAVPEETETTFAGNARLKARAAMQATGLPALADDSGLVVDALGGAPGVHTADWAETPTGRDFHLAMRRVHDELMARGAPEPWTARFVCVLALVTPEGTENTFEGRVEGRIVWPMRGVEGHGYDPIFLPDGFTRTFGEMSLEEKNRISHRARALERLVAHLADG